MAENNNGQDKNGEAQLQSELPTDNKATEEFELPEDANDRTREQFEKLKKHNQELAQKLEEKERQHTPSVLESLSPKQETQAPLDNNLFAQILNPSGYKHLNQGQIEQAKNDLIDEQGYLKADTLQQKLDALEARAKKAEERAVRAEKSFETYEQTSQTRNANEKYPYLDPNNENFDPGFYRAVKNELMGQMIETGKKDLVAAAEEVKKFYQLKPLKEKQVAQSAVEKQAEKAQINAGVAPSSHGSSAYTGEDYESLVASTRKGVKGSLAERLKRSGY